MERECCGGCGSGGGAESGAEAGASEVSLGAEAKEALAAILVCPILFLRLLLVLLPGIVGRAGEVVGEIGEASVMVVSVGVGAVRSMGCLWGVCGGWEGVSGARPG